MAGNEKNKPNLPNPPINVNLCPTRNYKKQANCRPEYKNMQNKPNLPNDQINVTSFITTNNKGKQPSRYRKKQTQSNPIKLLHMFVKVCPELAFSPERSRMDLTKMKHLRINWMTHFSSKIIPAMNTKKIIKIIKP